MDQELIKLAQQIMQQNPGMTPQQALQEAKRMSAGERSEDFTGGQAREAGRLGHMAQQQYAAKQAQQQQQRQLGLLGGNQQMPQRQSQQPGLLGGNQQMPQRQAPHPGIQRPPTPGLRGGKDAAWCAQMGGTIQGGSCVISLQF
jgi:hypothetical protein